VSGPLATNRLVPGATGGAVGVVGGAVVGGAAVVSVDPVVPLPAPESEHAAASAAAPTLRKARRVTRGARSSVLVRDFTVIER